VDFELENLPTDSTPGPIVAAVRSDLQADSSVVIQYGGISGTFSAPGWAIDTSSNFGVGKGVELTGTFTLPDAAQVPVLTNAKRGTIIHLIEMPALSDFKIAGTTKKIGLTFPQSGTHVIPDGYDGARWTTRARSEPGTIDLTTLDHGANEGLQRYGGFPLCVMIENFGEGLVLKARTFCTEVRFGAKGDDPEGSEDSTRDGNGMFQDFIILVAG
jgi:hypothetical protein